MLKEAKKALRVTDSEYDSELARLMMAGARDLELAGVILPGVVSFTITATNEEEDVVTDTSTLEEELAQQAVILYAACRFGNPPNYAQLKAAYDECKAQMSRSSEYTDYGMIRRGCPR